MRLPIIRGLIDRRILVNYRVDPEVLSQLLPAPFEPRLARGYAMVGICLIRLKSLRPAGLPAWLGLGSENAAHRAAVMWHEGDQERTGVYVPRRDTSSWINHAAGGQLFPGVQHRAQFQVQEGNGRFQVAVCNRRDGMRIAVRGQITGELAAGSIFRSLDEASEFFRVGARGYSPAGCPGHFQGMELCCQKWCVQPLEVFEASSSFFENEALFPKGSLHFDCALVMRGIRHEWRSVPPIGDSQQERQPTPTNPGAWR